MSRMNEPSEQSGGSGSYGETAQHVGENIREMGSHMRDVAAEQYEQVKRQAQEYYEQGREKAREMEQSLEHYVQEKPIQSLLIAAGVGMLLGILWKRI